MIDRGKLGHHWRDTKRKDIKRFEYWLDLGTFQNILPGHMAN